VSTVTMKREPNPSAKAAAVRASGRSGMFMPCPSLATFHSIFWQFLRLEP
jgi:hypothetical protein